MEVLGILFTIAILIVMIPMGICGVLMIVDEVKGK